MLKKRVCPFKEKSIPKHLTAEFLHTDLEISQEAAPLNKHTGLPQMKLVAALFYTCIYIHFSMVTQNICACAGIGGGTEGMRGHEWGTCCGNRYVCGFIEGEVKAEGHSCSCLEGLIDANNKRKEVKSRNCQCATVI